MKEGLTAKVLDGMIAGSVRRGFDQEAIKVDRHLNVAPPEHMPVQYKSRMEDLRDRREVLWNEMGQPNKGNLRKWKGKEHKHRHAEKLKEYLEAGDEIARLSNELSKIMNEVRTGVTLGTAFIDIAEELLEPALFEMIMTRARELEASGFTGTQKEWIEFTAHLDKEREKRIHNTG